ncbi:hypothetical protein ANCCAN_14058 [Ancylostoma caninum]|uniref:C3H1-type domain-containing protein n=1 Tax=Ancylostoma caninum TaxID=29170 RepID=A0A368G6F3_ANCCA|nr:hypothetical protein ANCCAN_14058 [Ancylostoma caninum]
MALNLICSYDSDEDSDSPPKEQLGSSDAEPSPPTEKGKSFFFGGDEGSSSDDGEEDQLNKSKHSEKKPLTSTTRRLPSAGSVLKGNHVCRVSILDRKEHTATKASNGSFGKCDFVHKHRCVPRLLQSSSVFSSEREQEDLAQQLTLSQHVPLTEKVEARKKPVCRAFQRGECKRGNRCRFAHPVAPQTPKDAAIVAGAPKMYNADDVFAKKAKIA